MVGTEVVVGGIVLECFKLPVGAVDICIASEVAAPGWFARICSESGRLAAVASCVAKRPAVCSCDRGVRWN